MIHVREDIVKIIWYDLTVETFNSRYSLTNFMWDTYDRIYVHIVEIL